MILDDLFQLYLAFTENVNSTQTTRSYTSLYNKHLKTLFGYRNIHTIESLEYQLFINNLLKNNLKPKTVKNLRALQKFLKLQK